MPKKKSVKKTSKRLAELASHYLNMTTYEWLNLSQSVHVENVRALAASVLVQYESEQPKRKAKM